MQKNIKNWWAKSRAKAKYLFFLYFIILTWSLLRKPGSGNSVDILGINIKAIYNDKVAHFSAFLLLAFLAILSFTKVKPAYFVIIITIYGVMIEILQKYMKLGRTFDYFDILADFLGTILGLILALFFITKMKNRT